MSDRDSTARVEFRTIDRYLGYRFHDDGTIWSCWTPGRYSYQGDAWREVKQQVFPGPGDYFTVRLKITIGDTKKYLTKFVHPLMCEAFHGERPPGLECRHKDGNGRNNRASNLCWGTKAENMEDRRIHGKANFSILNDEDVLIIREAVRNGTPQKFFVQKYGVRHSIISHIVNRRTFKHLP